MALGGRITEAVIFDMDGLMFDMERVFIEAWDYAGEKMGIGKAGYMTLKTLGMNKKKSEEVWVEEFGEGYDPKALHVYGKEYLTNYYENNRVPIKKGLYVLLDYLKERKYKLAVASSSPRWEVERHLRDAEVFGYFKVIVCGDMIEKSKPEPDIYLTACKELAVRPESAYALEDSKSGLLSAYRAGCRAIMVPDLWQPDDEAMEIAAGVFEDLEKVKEYFEKAEQG